MNKNIFYVILFFLVLSIRFGFSQNNWEYRSNYELKYSVSNNLDFIFKPKLWFNGIVNGLYSSDVEIGVDKKLNNWLNLNPYYRHIVSIDGNNRSYEYRPQVDLTVNKKLKDISFQSRNRFEYRTKFEDKSFRYRNKLTLKIPDYFSNIVQISVSEEIFYDYDKKEYNKNRIYFNFGFPFKNNITAEIFYILEHSKKENKWQNANVLGTTIKYKIKNDIHLIN